MPGRRAAARAAPPLREAAGPFPPSGAGRAEGRPPAAFRARLLSAACRSSPATGVQPERLGPVLAVWTRTESAVTPETASRAAAMVAKDYPFYLSVKRANCALDVEAASSPAKETEVLICWGMAATLFCLAACSALL